MKIKLPLIKKEISIWLLLVLLLLLVGLSYGSLLYTNRAEFCISCHEMQPAYDSWQQSAHSEANCEECHIKPGLINWTIRKMKSMKEVYVHFTSQVDPTDLVGTAQVADVNCNQCHEGGPETVGRFPHAKHVAQELACTNCHDRLVHGDQMVNRAACAECH